jgi:hypothetical protein
MTALPPTASVDKFDLIHTCRSCSQVCLNTGEWQNASELEIDLDDSSLSYGICPTCIKQTFPDCPTKFFRRDMDFDDASDLVPV